MEHADGGCTTPVQVKSASLFNKANYNRDDVILSNARKLEQLLGEDKCAVARFSRIMNNKPRVFSPVNSTLKTVECAEKKTLQCECDKDTLDRKEAKLEQMLGKELIKQKVLNRIDLPESDINATNIADRIGDSNIIAKDGDLALIAATHAQPPLFRTKQAAQPASSKAQSIFGEDVT